MRPAAATTHSESCLPIGRGSDGWWGWSSPNTRNRSELSCGDYLDNRDDPENAIWAARRGTDAVGKRTTSSSSSSAPTSPQATKSSPAARSEATSVTFTDLGVDLSTRHSSTSSTAPPRPPAPKPSGRGVRADQASSAVNHPSGYNCHREAIRCHHLCGYGLGSADRWGSRKTRGGRQGRWDRPSDTDVPAPPWLLPFSFVPAECNITARRTSTRGYPAVAPEFVCDGLRAPTPRGRYSLGLRAGPWHRTAALRPLSPARTSPAASRGARGHFSPVDGGCSCFSGRRPGSRRG